MTAFFESAVLALVIILVALLMTTWAVHSAMNRSKK